MNLFDRGLIECDGLRIRYHILILSMLIVQPNNIFISPFIGFYPKHFFCLAGDVMIIAARELYLNKGNYEDFSALY